MIRRLQTSALLGRLLDRASSGTFLLYSALAVAGAVAVILLGADIVRHIDAIEAWIAGLGVWGVAAFVVLYVVATSLLFPESVLSVMAGAAFGIAWGLGAVILASLLAAMLQYRLARHLLRDRIQRTLAARPAFAAIQRAVLGNEVKLQLLLRLTPVNPASVSYVLGAAGVRLGGFLLAGAAFLPHLVIEVWFGYAGKHVAQLAGSGVAPNRLHDLVVIGGLAAAVAGMVYLTHIARRALLAAAAGDAPDSRKT